MNQDERLSAELKLQLDEVITQYLRAIEIG